LTEDPLLTILVLAPTFVIVSLVFSLLYGMRRLRPYRPILIIVVAPGVIVHEVSHYLFCRLMRVKINKVRLLEFDEFWNPSGHVEVELSEGSFLKPLIIGVAPALLNTALACLLIISYPLLLEPWMEILVIWLTISLILSCRPSLADLGFAFKALVKYPRQSLREFLCLATGLLSGIVLYEVSPTIIGMELPPSLVAAFSMITIILIHILLRRT
jgi:hypothetical protein